MEDGETITLDMVRKYLNEEIGSSEIIPKIIETIPDTRDSFDKNLLLTTLDETNYNISKTASILHISRNTVYSKMKKYGIKKN